MAEIEVVIKIPEEMWKQIKKGYVPLGISKYLKNGVTLPKGHGRLIDADALNIRMEQRMNEIGDDESIWESSNVATALDMFAPTIIEADTAESEETK